MDKRKALEKLDKLIIEKMTTFLEENRVEELPSLSVVVQYLKANEQVAEKKKKTVSDRHKELIEQARRERENATK